MNEISGRIRSLMDAREMSYGELAKLTGLPKSALQRYATGDTVKIPLDRLELIAKALNVSSAYLMGWEERAEDDHLSVIRREAHEAIDSMDEEKLKKLLQVFELVKDM